MILYAVTPRGWHEDEALLLRRLMSGGNQKPTSVLPCTLDYLGGHTLEELGDRYLSAGRNKAKPPKNSALTSNSL